MADTPAGSCAASKLLAAAVQTSVSASYEVANPAGSYPSAPEPIPTPGFPALCTFAGSSPYIGAASQEFFFQVYKCSQPVVAALLARACIYNQLTVNTPARFSYGAFLAEASEEWVLWGTYGGQLRWERKELGERGLRHARLLLHCQLCSTCIASMPSTCSI